MKCILHSGISKPVEKLSMYNWNAILRTTLGQQHCFVNTILKTGIVIFTKNNIFATTLADNPIEITRSDYSAYIYVPNNQKHFMPGVGCDNIEIKNNLIIVAIGCFRKWDHKINGKIFLFFLFRPYGVIVPINTIQYDYLLRCSNGSLESLINSMGVDVKCVSLWLMDVTYWRIYGMRILIWHWMII